MKTLFAAALLCMTAIVVPSAFAQDELRDAVDSGDLATVKKMVKKGEIEEIYCGKLSPKDASNIYGNIFKQMPDAAFEQCTSQFSYGYGVKICANPKGMDVCSKVLDYLFADAYNGNLSAIETIVKVSKVALANKSFKKPLKEQVDTTMWVPCKKKGKAWKECIEACESYAEEIGDEERLATCKKKPAEYKETTITVSRPSPFFEKVKGMVLESYWKAPLTSSVKFAELMQKLAKPLSIPDTSIINVQYVNRWAEGHKAEGSELPGGELFRFCAAWSVQVDSIMTALEVDARCPVFTTFEDPRDNHVYKVKEIDGTSWFVQNLNYAVEEGSMCYDRDDENCNRYGRLYSQAAAKTACPEGTRLATDEDWKKLEDYVGGSSEAALKLRSNGSDNYAFTALFGGYANKSGISTTIGEGAYFWTEKSDEDNRGTARSMFNTDKEVSSISVDNAFYLSVRCVVE